MKPKAHESGSCGNDEWRSSNDEVRMTKETLNSETSGTLSAIGALDSGGKEPLASSTNRFLNLAGALRGESCKLLQYMRTNEYLHPAPRFVGFSWVAHISCLLRCIRTVRTHGKLRHVCATPTTWRGLPKGRRPEDASHAPMATTATSAMHLPARRAHFSAWAFPPSQATAGHDPMKRCQSDCQIINGICSCLKMHLDFS
jgi:hypothetical protein